MILPTYNILGSLTAQDDNINLIKEFPHYIEFFNLHNTDIEERSVEI